MFSLYSGAALSKKMKKSAMHVSATILLTSMGLSLCLVLPLVKKDGMPEKAREIIDELKFHFNCQYEEKDSVGKRYRRQDAIGTPYCVTVDGDTLNDDTVTIRFRDTMEQKRVKISELRGIIEDNVTITSLLKKLK